MRFALAVDALRFNAAATRPAQRAVRANPILAVM